MKKKKQKNKKEVSRRRKKINAERKGKEEKGTKMNGEGKKD